MCWFYLLHLRPIRLANKVLKNNFYSSFNAYVYNINEEHALVRVFKSYEIKIKSSLDIKCNAYIKDKVMYLPIGLSVDESLYISSLLLYHFLTFDFKVKIDCDAILNKYSRVRLNRNDHIFASRILIPNWRKQEILKERRDIVQHHDDGRYDYRIRSNKLLKDMFLQDVHINVVNDRLNGLI